MDLDRAGGAAAPNNNPAQEQKYRVGGWCMEGSNIIFRVQISPSEQERDAEKINCEFISAAPPGRDRETEFSFCFGRSSSGEAAGRVAGWIAVGKAFFLFSRCVLVSLNTFEFVPQQLRMFHLNSSQFLCLPCRLRLLLLCLLSAILLIIVGIFPSTSSSSSSSSCWPRYTLAKKWKSENGRRQHYDEMVMKWR